MRGITSYLCVVVWGLLQIPVSSYAANPPPDYSITEYVIPTAGAQPKNDNGDYEPSPIHYVSLSGAHVAPYTSWSMAATNIQAAIDVAVAGDTVLVANGIYDTGGRVAGGQALTNRLAIDKPITVQSVNGPSVTFIVGQTDPSTLNTGPGAVRCVYMINAAALVGFTLTNGYTRNSGLAQEQSGGGAWCEDGGVISNCVLTGNSASDGGGGAWKGTLYNCTLTGNSAGYGGGAYDGTLYNCTLTGNSAYNGGGTSGGTQYNCIVYYNTAQRNGPNFSDCTLNYCCTTPDPGGAGNITSEPQFVNTDGDYHLASGSHCIDAGNNAFAAGLTDLDGRSRIIGAAVDMGCYEAPQIYVGESPVHYVSLSGGNVWPYTNWVNAATVFQHAVDVADEGDTVLATNGVYETGGRVMQGTLANRVVIDKAVQIQSVNGPDVTMISGNGSARCFYLSNALALVSGFTITGGMTHYQSPMGSSDNLNGGGVYIDHGGTVEHCIIQGNKTCDYDGATWGGGVFVNGEGIIRSCTISNNTAWGITSGGGGGICLNGGGLVEKCVITKNSTSGSQTDGGGISCSGGGMVRDCIISQNDARWWGGGVVCYSGGTVENCLIYGNTAYDYGGGIYLYGSGEARNCTITGNSATYGGGTYGGAINNCIVYYNTAPNGSNYSNCTLNCSCTTPDPGGIGNIINGPMFVSTNAGNYRLQAGSPCINAGTNQDWMIGATDLDGLARIRGGRVDMGAYEYEYIPSAWLSQYGLPSDGSADLTDNDGDRMDNRREWLCNTDPTNATSCLRFTTSAPEGVELVLRWQSVEGVRYRLKRSTNLYADGFSYLVRTNVSATPPLNTETDKTAVGTGPWFYRVGVE